MLGIKHSMRGMSLVSKAMRANPTRVLSVSAVKQSTVSMREPVTVSSGQEESVYTNFQVPDNEKYKLFQQRQAYYTEHILEDSWLLTKDNQMVFRNFRIGFVVLALLTYLFTHYRITLGKRKREGQVI